MNKPETIWDTIPKIFIYYQSKFEKEKLTEQSSLDILALSFF